MVVCIALLWFDLVLSFARPLLELMMRKDPNAEIASVDICLASEEKARRLATTSSVHHSSETPAKAPRPK